MVHHLVDVEGDGEITGLGLVESARAESGQFSMAPSARSFYDETLAEDRRDEATR